MIQEHNKCRACGSEDLRLALDLGKSALANDFLLPDQVEGYDRILPLRLKLCTRCSLVQLGDVVRPEVLYSRYAYITSNSKTMAKHLKKLCDDLMEAGKFKKPPSVVELGSNTGVFLKEFQERGSRVLGVEPAENISALAQMNGVPTWTTFFNEDTAKKIAKHFGKADLIIGRHVFAHIDDWQMMMRAFAALTHKNSFVAIEVPHLADFFKNTEFDTVYHEHLSYVPVRAIQALAESSAGLAEPPFQLERVLHYPVHGGSIVFMLRQRAAKAPVHPSVKRVLKEEEELGLHTEKAWKDFAKRTQHVRKELPALLKKLKKQGKRIIGYGAAAKGNTLLNVCGVGATELDYIIDNTPFKQGKRAPGTWLPIHPPDFLLKDQPDYALILAWNFSKEIIAREKEYQKRGGRFIVPIPEPKIV